MRGLIETPVDPFKEAYYNFRSIPEFSWRVGSHDLGRSVQGPPFASRARCVILLAYRVQFKT